MVTLASLLSPGERWVVTSKNCHNPYCRCCGGIRAARNRWWRCEVDLIHENWSSEVTERAVFSLSGARSRLYGCALPSLVPVRIVSIIFGFHIYIIHSGRIWTGHGDYQVRRFFVTGMKFWLREGFTFRRASDRVTHEARWKLKPSEFVWYSKQRTWRNWNVPGGVEVLHHDLYTAASSRTINGPQGRSIIQQKMWYIQYIIFFVNRILRNWYNACRLTKLPASNENSPVSCHAHACTWRRGGMHVQIIVLYCQWASIPKVLSRTLSE